MKPCSLTCNENSIIHLLKLKPLNERITEEKTSLIFLGNVSIGVFYSFINIVQQMVLCSINPIYTLRKGKMPNSCVSGFHSSVKIVFMFFDPQIFGRSLCSKIVTKMFFLYFYLKDNSSANYKIKFFSVTRFQSTRGYSLTLYSFLSVLFLNIFCFLLNLSNLCFFSFFRTFVKCFIVATRCGVSKIFLLPLLGPHFLFCLNFTWLILTWRVLHCLVGTRILF